MGLLLSPSIRGFLVVMSVFVTLGMISLYKATQAQNVSRDLPDPVLTPGAVVDADLETICRPGYAKAARQNIQFLRNRIFASYHLIDVDRRRYEVDHDIPISLGGDPTDIRNLWPESRDGIWNAEVKDHLEIVLHEKVCAGEVPLREAQQAISRNWIDAYLKYVGNTPVRFIIDEPEEMAHLNKRREEW